MDASTEVYLKYSNLHVFIYLVKAELKLDNCLVNYDTLLALIENCCLDKAIRIFVRMSMLFNKLALVMLECEHYSFKQWSIILEIDLRRISTHPKLTLRPSSRQRQLPVGTPTFIDKEKQ